MTAHVILRGGDYSGVAGGTSYHFTPGTHEVSDPAVLEALKNADLKWVTVHDGPPPPATAEQLKLPEPDSPALPTPGQKLVAETKTAPEPPETVAAKLERVNAPDPVVPRGGYACPFCPDKVLKNAGARIAHVRHSHPDEYERWNASRLAAKVANAADETDESDATSPTDS